MPNLFRLFLIAILLLTSQALASARGQAQIAGQAVLCVGETVITLQVDANGEPVEIVTICPDMALTLMQGLAHHATLPVIQALGRALDPAPLTPMDAIRDSVARRVRDPPPSLA